MLSLLNSFFSYKIELSVTSSNGFHLRPIAKFSSLANSFSSNITISFKEKKVNAKSVNQILSLSLEEGDCFFIEGKKEAILKLEELFKELMSEEIEIKELKKDDLTYRGTILNGESIVYGISISNIYFFKEVEKKEETNISFDEALKNSLQELKESKNSIYLAQKELLSSLNSKNLEDLKIKIETKIEEIEDSFLESKRVDYLDILARVEKNLGISKEIIFPNTPFILVADDLLPSHIEKLKSSKVEGVILKETTQNSHTAILLRSEGVTSIILNEFNFKENQEVILDTYQGVFVTSFSEDEKKEALNKKETKDRENQVSYTKRDEKAILKNGQEIEVFANISTLNSAKEAKENGANGVGLFRTEFLFTKNKPTLEEQIKEYKAIFEIFPNITIRTLDIGGDKNLPYIDLEEENNPFLGIRGVRLFKTHPKIIEEQLKAIFIASNSKNIKIMFPMISSVNEFKEAKEFALNIAKTENIKKENINIENIEFGIMVEVPSVLFEIKEFNKYVDFYSIGTNDLSQYLFAIERTHKTLKIDPLSPTLFKALELIHKEATKPLSICGELAGDIRATKKLIEIGITKLSMSSKQIAKIKEEIRNV